MTASKHGVHKRPPVCFRPEKSDHDWLIAYSEMTGIPVNRIMADALTVFRSQLAIHCAEHDQEPDAPSRWPCVVRPADLAAAARIRADLKTGKARAQRIASGFSAADVARAMRPPVTGQAVHYWEIGRSVPTVEHALAYGRVLDALTREAALCRCRRRARAAGGRGVSRARSRQCDAGAACAAAWA